MYPYWTLFGFFAAVSMVTSSPQQWRLPANAQRPFFAAAMLILIALVGLRFEVGGDWNNYLLQFRSVRAQPLAAALTQGDTGYVALNWLVQRAGAEIWLVNLVCALLFGWGLLRFASTQPSPWLAVTIAIPYLVVVVAMGYTRQAAAMGILMAGLAAHIRGAQTVRFALYVAAAALLHRTAVVLLPLVVLASDRNRFVNILAGIAAFILLYDVFVAEDVERYVRGYIEIEYASQGAAIRVLMSLVPALLFFAMPRRFAFSDRERSLWRVFALAVIGCLIALYFSPSSTAVDRIALYLMPIQLAVLSRVPIATRSGAFGVLLVIAYSAAVQFTWLNFAANAEYWIPYRLYPLWG